MNQIQKILALVFGALVGAACASKGQVADLESGSQPVVVNQVNLSAEPNGSFISIKTSKEPKYNAFKLMDPERVIVDFIDARLGEDVAAELKGNEFVESVKVQAIEDSLSSLVRLEVALKSSANYLAELSSDGLSLKVLKVGSLDAKTENQALANVTEVEVAKPVEPAKEVPPALDATASEKEKPMVEAPVAAAPPSIEVPAPEAPPVVESVPMPEAAPETPKVLSEESIAPQAEVKAEAPPTLEAMPKEEVSASSAAPIPVPIPVPSLSEGESNPAKMASKKKKGAEKEEALGIKGVPIEITGLTTEGTSLLTELDNKVYTGRRVSLEFQDADVQDILRLIAEVSKLNIIAADDVKGKLSLKLIDVPWDQALDIILTTLGLDKTQHGNIIRVAPTDKLRREREVALANDKAAKQLEPLKLKLINVNYAKADEISARIKNLLSERGTVDTDSRTNTLIVKDIREHISRIENLIKALDTQTPQVRIESRIVQANDQFSRDLGIQWGPTLKLDSSNSKERPWQFPHAISAGNVDGSQVSLSSYAVDALAGATTGGTLGFRLGSVSDIFNLDLKLQYLEQESLGRVVSRPSISVLDNKTARIIQGTKIPYLSSSQNGTTVSFQEVGVEISVTPQITADGSVILKVNTRSNEPLSSSVGGNPITTIREANTEMLVKSGRTAVLGGVFKSSETNSEAGVPGLYRLPLLGWLFGSSKKSTVREETLVFITPYILNDQRVASTTPASDSLIEK